MKDWLSIVVSTIGIAVIIALIVAAIAFVLGFLMWLAVQVGG